MLFVTYEILIKAKQNAISNQINRRFLFETKVNKTKFATKQKAIDFQSNQSLFFVQNKIRNKTKSTKQKSVSPHSLTIVRPNRSSVLQPRIPSNNQYLPANRSGAARLAIGRGAWSVQDTPPKGNSFGLYRKSPLVDFDKKYCYFRQFQQM